VENKRAGSQGGGGMALGLGVNAPGDANYELRAQPSTP